ncbi:MAG: DUF2726 domain-containing protein [Pyrinomonadaceae bacterium]|nr:DUF2726 domain-containing protein [Phycisphaerales bacterium]
MPVWVIVVIIAAMLLGSVVIVWVSGTEDRRRESRRKRFEIEDSTERVPLVTDEAQRAKRRENLEDTATFLGASQTAPVPHQRTGFDSGDPRGGLEPDPDVSNLLGDTAGEKTGSLGRLVNTPDGETILTNPPFRLRGAVFSKRHGKYTVSMMRRLPPWLVLMPRVRLDTLVTPTSPDGRDPDDWRTWRRRVRMRSVDLILCDRRTWTPILAILFDRPADNVKASVIGGGRDNIVDEVLIAIGLPFVRATGNLKEDWHVIRPYVEQAMLPSVGDLDVDESNNDPLGGTGWDASAAVTLLKIDDEKGWLLE